MFYTCSFTAASVMVRESLFQSSLLDQFMSFVCLVGVLVPALTHLLREIGRDFLTLGWFNLPFGCR